MVESKLVELAVAGSSPVGHPTFLISDIRFPISDLKFGVRNLRFFLNASVAQLDRASDFGSEGCRFKSCRMHHLLCRAVAAHFDTGFRPDSVVR
jgi:hypothetical protein